MCDGPVRPGRRYCANACRQLAYRRRKEVAGAGNIVPYPDTFIGRQDEIAAIGRLLGGSRLVTVTGPAGSGKTRLATEVACRRRGHADGVWLIDLAAVSRGALVVLAIASTLGIRAENPAALAEALTGRKVLLVLDNCEHLLPECAAVAEELLARCGGLAMLATSREALRARGERVFPLGELTLPVGAVTRHQAARSDAVRLFVDRASAVDPGFRLTDANTGAVVALCERLDGMPLAIELAARRVRVLGLTDLLSCLADRLDVLSVGGRTSASRHRSLNAAIGWDYDSLTAGEQALWRRLSVLAGPFPLELAKVVSGLDDVVDPLAGLEAKSLLTPVDVDGSVWFRQLESIRVFGRERLAAAELASAGDRLAEWMLARFGAHLIEFSVPPSVLRELGTHWHNLVVTVEWTASTGDPRHAPLACVLAAHWLDRGINAADTQEMLVTALRGVPAARPDYAGLLLSALSTVTTVRGELDEARSYADRAVELERTLNRPARLARALDEQGHTRSCAGDHSGAKPCYLESLELLRALGDPVALLGSLNNLAWAALSWGERALAAELLSEALPLAGRLGSPSTVTAVVHTAGVLALFEGDAETAGARFADSLAVDSENPQHVAYTVDGLGIVAVERGDDRRGLRLIACAAAIRERARTPSEPFWQERVDAAVATASTRLRPRDVAAAHTAGRKVTLERAAEVALHGIAQPPSGGRRLSAQEHTIATLVAEGFTNDRIARRLRVSERTVTTHLERIREKLDVRSRAEVAAWVAREGQTVRSTTTGA
ncbi:ATP-binding protein [Amycolatopsis sp. NPDC059657]|uniref:ATP-binding protein n=1 Tax=Amycolatopsis sp. NPDC059657 TaxID=3346899 RepID=UPI00366BBEA8